MESCNNWTWSGRKGGLCKSGERLHGSGRELSYMGVEWGAQGSTTDSILFCQRRLSSWLKGKGFEIPIFPCWEEFSQFLLFHKTSLSSPQIMGEPILGWVDRWMGGYGGIANKRNHLSLLLVGLV